MRQKRNINKGSMNESRRYGSEYSEKYIANKAGANVLFYVLQEYPDTENQGLLISIS